VSLASTTLALYLSNNENEIASMAGVLFPFLAALGMVLFITRRHWMGAGRVSGI
jgi:glucose-6-phosphate-specific signal transduction histidine kinase